MRALHPPSGRAPGRRAATPVAARRPPCPASGSGTRRARPLAGVPAASPGAGARVPAPACALLAQAPPTLRPRMHFTRTTVDLDPRKRALGTQSAVGRGQPAQQSTAPHGELTAPREAVGTAFTLPPATLG